MARRSPTKKRSNRQNTVPTAELKLRTTQAVLADLERLVRTGYFGKTPREAAEALLRDRLRQLMREEGIPRASLKPEE